MNEDYNIQSDINKSEYKEPKKRSSLLRALGVVGLAAAFGLTAAATFHGYNYITRPNIEEESAETNETDSNLQLTEVAIDQQNGEELLPAKLTEDAIVTDVSDVVSKVMPSIVAINSTGTVTGYDLFGREYNQTQEGSGSGIIIGQNDSKLLIVTNNHVIEGADEVEIVFEDNTTALAMVKGADANADLAVVSVDLKDLSKETLSAIKVAVLGDSDVTQPGEMAIAIGNALGYGQSVTVGYISAVNRVVELEEQTMTLLQTDAAINPGNSGGALLNVSGQVIGINSMKFASQNVEGMGYAIPISTAIPMINELMNREEVSENEKGFLGINFSTAQEVTELYAERFNMPVGVYINDVAENSPAEKAGLKSGDIVTGLDGVTIKTIEDLGNALQYKKEGQSVKLTIQVKESGSYVEKILDITLAKRR